MSEEIDFYDDELKELQNDLENAIDNISKLKGVALSERLHELDLRMKRAKQALQSFKVEMRELTREDLPKYDLKAQAHHMKLVSLQAELQQARASAERRAVGLRTADDLSTGEILVEAAQTQSKSLKSLGRMKTQIAGSLEMGAETNSRLREQTEQLRTIDDEIHKVRNNLIRADTLIKAFVRKMMTDKIIMCFTCFIFIGVLTIIIYKVVDPNGSSGDDEASASESISDPTAERRRLLFTSA